MLDTHVDSRDYVASVCPTDAGQPERERKKDKAENGLKGVLGSILTMMDLNTFGRWRWNGSGGRDGCGRFEECRREPRNIDNNRRTKTHKERVALFPFFNGESRRRSRFTRSLTNNF